MAREDYVRNGLILQGIVGSTAYGLNRENSDIDRLGVFVAPTLDIAGLDWHTRHETKVEKISDGDATFHEVGKYLRLALKCNPTILELLWLPGEYIEIMHPFVGTRLIALKGAFLSEKCVRDSYGGYAKQQAQKLSARGDSFSSDTKNRTTKHARHLLRLLRQGRELLATGGLTIRVSDPEEYWAFDHMPVDKILTIYEEEDRLFSNVRSVLPVKPNVKEVKAYLDLVRKMYLERE